MPKLIENFESSNNLSAPSPGKPTFFGIDWIDAEFPSLRVSPLGWSHTYADAAGVLEGKVIGIEGALTGFVLSVPASKVTFDYYLSDSPIPGPERLRVTYYSEAGEVIGQKTIAGSTKDQTGTLVSDNLSKKIAVVEMRTPAGGSSLVVKFVMDT